MYLQCYAQGFSMSNQPSTSKDKSFTIRVDENLLKTFQEIAKANDRPSAQLLRDFMREYIKKHKQGELKF